MTIHCTRAVRNLGTALALLIAAGFGTMLLYHARLIAETDVRVLQLLKYVPNGVIVCDHTGKVLFANEATTALTGFTREELTASGLDLIIPESFRQTHTDAFNAAVMRATHAGHTEVGRARQIYPVLRKDGTMFKAVITLGVIPRDGKPEFFGFITPVYSHKAHDLTKDMPPAVFEER